MSYPGGGRYFIGNTWVHRAKSIILFIGRSLHERPMGPLPVYVSMLCMCVCVCVLVRGLWWSCREISLFSFRNISIWAHRDNQLCLTESNNCMMAYFRIQFEMNIKRWYFSLLVYMINACGHAGGCCNWSCLKSVFGSKHEAQKHILTLATSYNLTRFMKRHSAEQNVLCLLGIFKCLFSCLLSIPSDHPKITFAAVQSAHSQCHKTESCNRWLGPHRALIAKSWCTTNSLNCVPISFTCLFSLHLSSVHWRLELN